MQHRLQQDDRSEVHGEGHDLPRLGPFLCWAVVFADIGTSIYYVPGILYGTVNKLAGFFVLLTMIVFILLTFKYVEVTYRFPQGGGVVTVSARALNRWFGALGGMFILVDYFLTAAISCLSGMLYLSVVVPAIGPQHTLLGLTVTLLITLLLLILLGVLNWIGVSESARVSMVAACIAFASDLAILVTVFAHLSFSQFLALFPQMFSSGRLTPVTLLVGYAGSFLAFSGLESISQLSPVMKLPRSMVGRSALFLVVLTVGLTSPLLAMLSTLLLPQAAKDPVLSSQIISLLGGKWGGPFLQTEVAISASALLVFASNTAIIGSYHVFLALSRMSFFPTWLLNRNKLRGTPHFSIGLATLVPIIVLLIVNGNINILGDMYAFGLLGAFSLTCISMDIVRHRSRKIRHRLAPIIADPERREKVVAEEEEALENEKRSDEVSGEQGDPHAVEQQHRAIPQSEQPEPQGRWTRSTINFWLGILTTFLVMIAWGTNLVAKPLATAFGGTVAVLGMIIAYANYRHEKNKGRVTVLTTGVERNFPAQVLAVLVDNDPSNEAVVAAALNTPDKKPVVFLYLGKGASEEEPELFRLIEPHLNDKQAREVLAHVNARAQEKHIDCRFVYSHKDHKAIYRIWQALHPAETIVSQKETAMLDNVPIAQVEADRVTPDGQVVRLTSE
ncbi:MAG TPA: APC family permease [Ktedonobacteraceae bacterium]|nr:APC family permease [Ktedonobacteraceae bacterium]